MMFGKEEPQINKADFAQFVFRQVVDIASDELMILKGHLLIEYALNKYIDTVSEWSQSIDDTNFTFSHKVKICSMLGLFVGNDSSLEGDINLFNKIRNQIAHKLSYDHELLNTFIKRQKFVNEAILKFGDTPTDLKLLQGAVIYICGQIAGLTEGRHKFDKDAREVMRNTVLSRKSLKPDDYG